MCNCKSDLPLHLASIGFLCSQVQRSYLDVFQTLTDAGVKPAVVINLVPHFDWNEASRALEQNPPMIQGANHAE